MNRQREIELLERLRTAGAPGPLGAASLCNPAAAYTCPERFERERRALFRGTPNLVGLSAECPAPGDYVTGDLGGIPIVVVRGGDGLLRGFVNACRHRGARLLDGAGRAAAAISCPYHGWRYRTDGTLQRRPGAEPGFDDVPRGRLSLLPVEVGERHGLIFASAAGGFDVDEALAGAQEELAAYGIGGYCHMETREQEVPFNWKLAMDTFTEPYHIAWLHKASISPHYYWDRWIFDAYGPHGRLIGVRRTVDQEFARPESDRRLLPHGTTQYLLLPNAVLCHQIDHIELWRFFPLSVDRTRVTTALFAPRPPETEKQRVYWRRNLDVLLQVTNSEDFPMMARIQQNLASGALPEVVYGRMEPALAHFHRAVNETLESGGKTVS
ncbi:MAG: aromatic ring-hydroxylating dioxygenase subunit alpha [Sphingomonadales bacterium]